MSDLVLFQSSPPPAEPSPLDVDVRSAPRAFFLSVPALDSAIAHASKTRHLHFPAYQPDLGLARLIADGEGALVVSMGDFIHLRPPELAVRLAKARELVRQVLHFGGRVRIASLARSPLERRNALERAAFGVELGLTRAQAQDSVGRGAEGAGEGVRGAGGQPLGGSP